MLSQGKTTEEIKEFLELLQRDDEVDYDSGLDPEAPS
jgi:hypothetical protein